MTAAQQRLDELWHGKKIAPPEPAKPEWVDTPREEWGDYPLLELLPEHRQRYWQQRCTDQYGSVTRYHMTSTSIIKAEVYAQTMSRLMAVLEKLERKL
jgi:hypothetical protein